MGFDALMTRVKIIWSVQSLSIFGVLFLFLSGKAQPKTFATRDEMVASRSDQWGETAMLQPNGPGYEAFEKLLPPPRYVNADFRFYPIVLSAPNARVKARLISNGSGVNLRGGSRSWNEVGTPAIFRVGPDEFKFGEILSRLEHPTLAEGYLPIPEIRYAHGSEVYRLEAFASTDPALADNGIVLVSFSLASGTNGIITVEVNSPGVKFVIRDRKSTRLNSSH